MRVFKYSKISNHFGVPNMPGDPNLAVEAGRRLCAELLDPVVNTFGRNSVRSGAAISDPLRGFPACHVVRVAEGQTLRQAAVAKGIAPTTTA